MLQFFGVKMFCKYLLIELRKLGFGKGVGGQQNKSQQNSDRTQQNSDKVLRTVAHQSGIRDEDYEPEVASNFLSVQPLP